MNNTNLYGIKNGLSNYASDVMFIVLFCVLTLLTVLVAVWLINLSIKKKTRLKGNQILGIMLVVTFVGLAIRILLSFLITGHRDEYTAIAGEGGVVWKIIEKGFSGYYSSTNENAIYPLSLYFFSLFATLGSWFGMTTTSVMTPFLIKLPLILADLGCIILLYKAGKKYFNPIVAITVSGLYALCPVFMFASSVWGSVYAFVAFFLLLTFYFLVDKKYFLMFVSYSLAILTAKEAVYLFPVIAVFVVYRYIKTIQVLRAENRTNKLSFTELIKSPEKGLVIRLPLYFIGCLLGMYLISLPFIIQDYDANIFIFINEFFIKGLAKVEYYSHNALSLYNLFNMNGSFFNSNLVPLFIVLFLAIIVTLTLMYYLSKKNRANLVMLAAFIYMTLSIFFIDFREMTSYPLLAILLFSFILIKDKRLLQVFALYAIILVINASIVMAYGGYLNNIAESQFYTNNDYFGGSLLESTVGNIMNIILSVMAVLTYLHFTFVLMDISMNYMRKPFEGQETLSPLTAMKHWIVK